VVGNRVPNAFVQRSGDTENALASVAALADDLGEHDAIVLYPEGTRFSPERQARALARLNPERRERCAAWRHVMPPHSGGVAAVLAARTMDVVFCAHRGLEPAATAKALLNGSMIGQRVDVALWRVEASKIPEGRAEQALWLDAMWAEMERRVEAMRRPDYASSQPLM
jgi:1-acyl-sn-glycerol-3-phosphate acyltransferase